MCFYTEGVSLLCQLYVADTPDMDEAKQPGTEAAAAEDWDVTSPPIEQRSVEASANATPPEKKKKPRNRGMGNLTVVDLFRLQLRVTRIVCGCVSVRQNFSGMKSF